MNPAKYHLILNPRSRGGKAERQFDVIFSLMKDAGLTYDCVFADTYEKIHDASVAANAGDYDVIVAVGGDGTINATINGFYYKQGLASPNKMLGVIYTGTSPDFCKSYGVPLNMAQAVDAIRRRKVREIRIGMINLHTCLDPPKVETRYFSCCASIGIGAMVAEKANKYRKYAGDTIGALAAIFSSLFTFQPAGMMVIADNTEKKFPRVTNIFVGRTKYIASGIKVKEEVSDRDSRFYVLCVNNLNMLRLPGLLRQLYSGDMSGSPVLEVFYADEISIDSPNKTARVEFDGDAAGFSPCSILAAAAPLNLIISPQDL
jgi:diacylglycerol kinase family enzyme